MALNLESCLFLGPALPEPFVAFDLETELTKEKVLPKNTGAEGRKLRSRWEVYRRHVRELVSSGGPIRVRNSVVAPLMEFLGYERIEPSDLVHTREGDESGGDLLITAGGEHRLRVWTTEFDTDLDAPQKRGLAARFSPVRIAQRVLLTSGERVGVVTNGVELRVLISEPARPDSEIVVKIDPEWKRSRNVPDSFRLVVALCCPKGVRLLPDLIDKARLKQTRVTKDLRDQARKAVEDFVQGVLDHPDNQERLRSFDKPALAKQLWREGLVTIYRLLFILKAESSDDPARSFSFAGTSIWRNTYSPTTALARFVEPVLRNGAETGSFLEDGLRRLFDAFAGSRDLRCIEMNIKPLGGALFGAQATPVLSELKWGERACASLLDCLLWTQPKRGRTSRERVYYGPLDVEDLGRVYEALLELEPGIAEEPMCRLRRQKLEVVVPLAQGEKYRIQDSGFRIQGGKDRDDSDVSRLAGLAEGDGSGRGVLQGDSVISEGTAVWSDQPATESGSVSSGEYSGGTRQAVDGRLSASPVNGAGFSDGVGNSSGDSVATGLPAGDSNDRAAQPDFGDRSNVERIDYGASGEEEDTDPESEILNPRSSKVQWIEKIDPGRFYLRVGLGRKASGSYYTPHSFVRFLVQETLGPQVAERSPSDDPNPNEILRLKVLDPAMGSGHFLVEACRFLGSALYEACRLCDEKMLAAEKAAEAAADANNEAAFHKAAEEAEKWRQRLLDLPDPNDEILQYLPSHAPEGEEAGYSSKKAEALCRRLVAVHCLYGVDKNPLAVELAKLSLWLESQGEGLPLTFLDHRLVVGDSLTGPFWEKLLYYPGSGQVVEDLFTRDAGIALTSALKDALDHVKRLDTSVGMSLAEISEKEAARAELERSLAPFKVLAAAWSGGVMLGPGKCDDMAYARLLKHIGETGQLPDTLDSEALRAMIACGLGLDSVPADRESLLSLLIPGSLNPESRILNPIPALSYDLTFPEVFYPTGVPFGRRGFDAVLGNPPWDTLTPKAKEFYASFDFGIMDAPTKRERVEIEKRLKTDAQIARLFAEYEESFKQQARIRQKLYEWQVVEVDGDKTGGDPDCAKLFMERGYQLLSSHGITGVVVPSAFHANEGATGVRRLYLEHMKLNCCYSFENRRKLFEIDSRFKFATVVAQRGAVTESFPCAFYLHDDSWLFADRDSRQPLEYSLDFVRKTGGEYLSFLELRSAKDLEVAQVCFQNGEPFGEVCKRLGIRFGNDLHMTNDAWRFVPTRDVLPGGEDPRDPEVLRRLIDMGYLVLHEGKTFHQYDDHWGERPRYVVPLENLSDSPALVERAQYYRLVFREVASSTNERTAIFCLVPPGAVFGHKGWAEQDVCNVALQNRLSHLAVCDCIPFDFSVRLTVSSCVSLFIVNRLPVPKCRCQRLLARSALRLTCNHSGYAPLWREQLGDVWREKREPFTWPVLEGDDERWQVRAAIDAVVADAYGLNREQYEHVLSTFSHRSYPKAPTLCLAKFDELKTIGLEEFTRKYDPYWDIPLVETLPKPVIDLPIPAGKSGEAGQGNLEM